MITIRGVNKRFGGTHAVRDLDLDVPAGSLCGFLGPNGAGKSTTIRMIMSIIYPDTGSIEVLGGNALAAKDRIGYLPEERGVYRKMRVGDFLEYMALLKGLPRRGLRQRVLSWLERIELPGVQRKKCEELSKGMQQKVQFVAAVIHEPRLLILDEPFSGLDPMNSELLSNQIRGLHAAGTTVVFSTHVLHQAEQICDRIFLINHGVKLLDASLEEIRRRFDPRTVMVEPLDGAAACGARGTGPAAALSALDGAHGIRAVRALGSGGALELDLEEGADPQGVMAAVVAAIPVRAVERRRPTLNDVFVRLVRADEGEEAAQRARQELER